MASAGVIKRGSRLGIVAYNATGGSFGAASSIMPEGCRSSAMDERTSSFNSDMVIMPTAPVLPPADPIPPAETVKDVVAPEIGVPVEFSEKKKKKKIMRMPTFEDKFELTGVKLGEGASCIVNECRSLTDNELYAVKTVSKAMSGFSREQVFQEVDLLHECKGHPNILQLIAFFDTATDFKLVFEKLDGGELLTHIQERKTFTELEASQVTRDIASALSFLHGKGIAHRDLKPQNILCKYRDKASPAKLADFNLGSAAKRGGATTPPLTVPVGTPEYMAPEVVDALNGDSRYDKRCDIWSLGVIVYIMLCGYPPFSGDCGMDCGWKSGLHCEFCQDILQEHIRECVFDFPSREWARISGAAKDLIAHMLVREDKRITAAMCLKHPWVSQRPPNTLLPTPGLLRQLSTKQNLESFASEANEKNRLADLDESTHELSLEDGPRSRPMMIPSSRFEDKSIDDIHTPMFTAIMGNPRRGLNS